MNRQTCECSCGCIWCSVRMIIFSTHRPCTPPLLGCVGKPHFMSCSAHGLFRRWLYWHS